MKKTLKRLTCLVGLAAAAGLPGIASATTINMIVSNLDVQFEGMTQELFEVADPDFGASSPGDSQQVSAVEFELDGITQALLMNTAADDDDLFVDLLVPNLGTSLTLGSLIEDAGGTGSPAFSFDWFDDNGNFLRLAIDSINYLAVDIPVAGTGLFNFFAEATVIDQNLPGGLAYQEDVLLSFTATDAAFLGGPTSASSVRASGALTITGTQIPEPGTLCLIGIGLSAVSAFVMRRRLG